MIIPSPKTNYVIIKARLPKQPIQKYNSNNLRASRIKAYLLEKKRMAIKEAIDKRSKVINSDKMQRKEI